MIRPQPLIVVEDIEQASLRFQQVLGLRSGHGGDGYEMLMSGSDLVAQLHQWEADEHPHLGDPADPSRGNGVLLWYWTDDFDEILHRVETTGAAVLDGPVQNANSGQREVWLRGPEGCVVVVAAGT